MSANMKISIFNNYFNFGNFYIEYLHMGAGERERETGLLIEHTGNRHWLDCSSAQYLSADTMYGRWGISIQFKGSRYTMRNHRLVWVCNVYRYILHMTPPNKHIVHKSRQDMTVGDRYKTYLYVQQARDSTNSDWSTRNVSWLVLDK